MKKALYFPVLFLFSTFIFSGANPTSMDELKNQVVLDPAGPEACKVLVSINRLYHKTDDKEGALKYLETVQNDYKSKEIEAAAVCLSVPYLLSDRKFEEVLQKCLYVKNNFKGTYWVEESLYNLGELYLNVYEDKTTADIYFKELVSSYPPSGLTRSAKAYLGK